MKNRFEGGLAVFLVIAKVGKEEWNPGIFEVMLSVIGVVLGRVGEKGCVGWEGWVEDDHASANAVQATRSYGGDRISVKAV